MIYSTADLYNCHVHSEAQNDFEDSLLSEESFAKIQEAYPCSFYTPNIFFAIALGLLTLIAVLFATFFVGLIISFDLESGISVVSFFMAAICYILLELIVANKKYYNAGVDNMLMVSVLAFTGTFYFGTFGAASFIWFSFILMIVSGWLSVRFSDAFQMVVSCAFFLSFCFLLIGKAGMWGMLLLPFLMMIIIATLYVAVRKLKGWVNFIYQKRFSALTVFLLVAFYAAGNFWVVETLQAVYMYSDEAVSFGWIFKTFTFLVPLLYIAYGVVRKDLLHIRTGLLLTAVSILVFHYYFSFLPIELEMLLLGIFFVAVSYFLIKLLRPSYRGFTSEPGSSKDLMKHAEALIIADSLSGATVTVTDQLMSGGSGGGGGATGDF